MVQEQENITDVTSQTTVNRIYDKKKRNKRQGYQATGERSKQRKEQINKTLDED
jgi:hypothetical protein